jgi:ribonuclease HI
VEALNESMKSIATKRPTLAKRITFHWISSHSRVEGNKVADQLAKEAAAGSISPAHLLPQLLAKRVSDADGETETT